MIQMIIIDDEALIRESLNRFIDWESIDINVCDTASNGVSAMASILNHKPDIILTDIRMPGLNGLELIRLLREQNLSSEVIFISAHTNFEYAKQAITLGAFGYITKPIDEEELLNTVNRCKTKIIEKQKKLSILSNYSEGLKSHQQYVLSYALSSNTALSDEEWESLSENSLTASYPCAVAVGFWYDLDKTEPFSSEFISDIFTKKCSLPYLLLSPYPEMQLIICFSESESLWNLYHNVLDLISLDYFRKENLLITVSSPHLWNRSLTIFYTEIALAYSITRKEKRAGIVTFKDSFSDTNTGLSKNEFIDTHFSGPLNHSEIEPLLKNFLLYFISDETIYDLGYIKLEFIRLIDYWIEKLRNYHLHDYLQRESLSVQKAISSQTSIDQVYETVYNLFWNITDSLKELDASTSKRLVRNSIAYIHENYDKSFTLVDLANHLYVSPAYLSKLFSAEIGEPFSKYLLNYRIQKAIEYMKNSEYKLYTIASLCGFSDITYFSKAFKSVTGMSPQKYKNTKL